MKHGKPVWIATAVAGLAALLSPCLGEDAANTIKERDQGMKAPFQVHQWQRDPRNPVLPPGGGDFDVGCCMNPFVIRQGDEYYLFYSGADKKGTRRICLAIAPVSDITQWKRLGPLFDVGGKGSFDETWCVLPMVHKFGSKWHLYYTGRSNAGGGLQAFYGMGLATSDDLVHWTKVTTNTYLLTGDGFPQWPKNRAIAGGGMFMDLPQPDGRTLVRMYYTLPTGTTSKDLLVDQAKQAVIAHSYDGIEWFDKRVILQPRLEADYENAAVIALNVWKTKTGYRAIYGGIGSRFGAYSICEATSADSLAWERGAPDENLALPPSGTGWESKMTEYPHVVEENGKLRLFYCGNGYGATGIGTALADPLP